MTPPRIGILHPGEMGISIAAAQQSGDQAGTAEKNAQRVCGVTAKAWRFAGEMEEIAATFEGAGIPGYFHTGAAILYRRLAQFKNARSTPSIKEVLAALLTEGEAGR